MRLIHFLMALLVITALIGVSSFYRTTVSHADDEKDAIGFVNYEDNGTMVCRDATTQEAREMMERDPNVRLRPISPIRPNQTGLKIILRGTQQLDTFPQAKAAFVRAAARWEGLILNPITIIIDVDFGPTRFGRSYGPGVLGSTTLPDNVRPYEDVRNRILSKTSSQFEASLYNLLPSGSIPTDIGSATSLTIGTPQLRA